MSGIGAVGGADKHYVNIPSKTIEKNTEAVQSEPQDKVDVKRGPGKARKAFETVLGSPTGLVTSAANAVGGMVGGGVAGVKGEALGARSAQGLMSGAAYIAMGAAAGSMIATPLVGGIVGAAVGVGLTVLSIGSGSTDKIAEKVGQRAEKAVSDNEPSDNAVRDTTMKFTEGAVVGTFEGGKEGFKHGIQYGAGIVSGVIEGTKGLAGSLAGTYETKPEKEAGEKKESFGKRVLNAVLSAPRKAARTAVGTVTGMAGAALGLTDGAIQGLVVGGSDNDSVSKSAHKVINTIQTIIAGAGAGMVVGGPLGAGIGAGAGLVAGLAMSGITSATGADEIYADNLTQALEHAKKDNTYEAEKDDRYQTKNTYETFRDGVEGLMTGAGAGVREGFKESYQMGKGITDGVFDAGKGILKGIAGGIKGAVKHAPESEVPQEDGDKKLAAPEEKPLGKKIIEIPGNVIKAAAGTAAAAVTTPLHILPGALQGLNRAANKEEDGKVYRSIRSDKIFHKAMYLQNTLLAAGAGLAVGGPIGAAIGGVSGLTFTGITHWMGDKTEVYDKMQDNMANKIGEALKDNKGTPLETKFQDLTEGTIIGAASAVKTGAYVGYEAGKGIVSGVVSAAEGIAEGIYEVGKNVVTRGPNPPADKTPE